MAHVDIANVDDEDSWDSGRVWGGEDCVSKSFVALASHCLGLLMKPRIKSMVTFSEVLYIILNNNWLRISLFY